MANLIVIVVLLVIVGISVSYIMKEKKRGVSCIGCPHAGECTKKRQGEYAMREYFLQTDRIVFSKWRQGDVELAKSLWGSPEVTRFICASGIFSEEDVMDRLNKEIENNEKYQVQYWPIFEKTTEALIGCCGLRPYREGKYEIGFHLCPEFWGQGYAVEAANAVIDYAFVKLQADGLFAGHNPRNAASRKVLEKLGFRYVRDEFYEPTGLYHPSYEMERKDWV